MYNKLYNIQIFISKSNFIKIVIFKVEWGQEDTEIQEWFWLYQQCQTEEYMHSQTLT